MVTLFIEILGPGGLQVQTVRQQVISFYNQSTLLLLVNISMEFPWAPLTQRPLRVALKPTLAFDNGHKSTFEIPKFFL